MASPHMPWRLASVDAGKAASTSVNADSKTAAGSTAARDSNNNGGLKSSPKHPSSRLPWDRSSSTSPSSSPPTTTAAGTPPPQPPTAVTAANQYKNEGTSRTSSSVTSPRRAAAAPTTSSTIFRASSSRSTLPPSSSSDSGRATPTEQQQPQRPRPSDHRDARTSSSQQKVAAVVATAVAGSSGPASTGAAAAPNVKRSAGGASARPGFRRGSSAAAAAAQRRRAGLPITPEQGETSSSSSSERGRAVGDGGGSGAAAGERKGGLLAGGGVRRGDKKEVARSDRRRTRGALAEAATRITSGNVSYQIGQEIGRGGFGTVFQALNTATGDFVAVKRMDMDSVQLDAGASIKGEIDLLKKLNHPNIVKYIDTIQTEGHLHIVLEVMESSLSAMCKKFGNFSESLTAIYMTQVLEGLKYLHDQGVLHRDIKGANILTTKHGLVKLADFGVAMKLSDKQASDVDVVGTPYWMAPEIIEMTGTTTACDVWSVGCTIIELLEGKPPYFDLPQMTALYKIVQDDHPPLPDGISQALRDFLLHCFKKQAQMRKSAFELLSHPWLKNPTNHLRKTMKVGTVELNPGEDDSQRQAVLKTVRTTAQLMQARSPKRRYDLSESDVRDISSIANLDEVVGPTGLPPGRGPARSGVAGKVPVGSSGGGAFRRGNIPPPAAALAAAKRRTGGTGAGEGQDWDQDWDRELGLVMPSLPDSAASLSVDGSGGGDGGGPQPANLTTIAPASEEAKQRLRALKGAEERARNQPLLLKTLDVNALDDWGDDDDDDEIADDGFSTSTASSMSGTGGLGMAQVKTPVGAGTGLRLAGVPGVMASGGGGWATGGGGGAGGARAGGLMLMGVGAGIGGRVPREGHTESFEHSPVTLAIGEAGGSGEGVIGMEATVLRRFMEEDDDEDAFDEMDAPEDRPWSAGADEQDPTEQAQETQNSFADNLKAKMLSHQGNAAAVVADDGFDDLFGAGFEELAEEEEGETGEKAERELHAKVGQEVFAELSRLESSGLTDQQQQHAGVLRVKPVRSSGWRRPGSTDSDGGGGSVGEGRSRAAGETLVPLAGVEEEVEEPEDADDDLGGDLGDDLEDGDQIEEEEEVEEARGGGRREVLTVTEEVVETCVRVRDMLEACPQARHYVMSADRGVTPLMYLMQVMNPEDEGGEEATANVLAVINKIVEGNLKALESLAMVGLVPKVMAVLEARSMSEEDGEGSGRGGAVSGCLMSEATEDEGSVVTDARRRRRRSTSSGGGGGRPKMHVEAARLVRALCNGSDLTLQTFISCGGLAVLARFVEAGPAMDAAGQSGVEARRLVRIGIDGVLKVFSLQRIRRNDFCKLFLRLGLMSRIMDTFTRFLGRAMSASAASSGPTSRRSLLESEGSVAVLVGAGAGVGGAPATAVSAVAAAGDLFWPYLTRAAETLMTFSKSDSVVKEGVAEEQCLQGIMRALSSVCPDYVTIPEFCSLAVTLLTVLKNVSMEPSTLEALDKAGAIATLVSLLGLEWNETPGMDGDGVAKVGGGGGGGARGGAEDLENQVLQCMFYLCRISRKRQEKAAVAGLIPHLRRCVLEQSKLKQFALQMVCDFAHTSSLVRSLMWDEGVLEFYLSVMRNPKDRHWHVTIFRSVCAWLSSERETERVAGQLVEPLNLNKVIFLFCTAQQVEFEEVVDKLHIMMDKSLVLVKALASSPTFIVEVMERLHYPKAVVGKTLLGMLRQVHQHHPDPAGLVRDFDLYRVVLQLSRNESQVLVAELAAQLLQDFDQRKIGGGGREEGAESGVV